MRLAMLLQTKVIGDIVFPEGDPVNGILEVLVVGGVEEVEAESAIIQNMGVVG